MESIAGAQSAELPPVYYEYITAEQDVEFKVMSGRYTVAHRLRRPTFSQLRDREHKIKNEAVALSKEETSAIYSEREANSWLWEEIVTHIRGYDIGDGDSENWREAAMLKRAVPVAHREAAVQKLYAVTARLADTRNEEELGGYKLMGASSLDVALDIGAAETPDFIVYHRVRIPSESEWSRYSARALETREVRVPGSREKSRRVRVIRNLQAAVELYNAIFEEVREATFGGLPYSADKREMALGAIDAIHKQLVVQALEEVWSFELGN